MEFGVLGPLEARREGDPIELGRPQQRAVLAVLLTQPNQTVPLDRLVDLLWGENPPSRAAAVVQGHISTLRRVLEPDRPTRSQPKVLVTHSPGYRLVLGAEDLDAARFEALAAQGHRLLIEGGASAAHRTLAEALALWRGPALVDIIDYPFAQAEATRLDELRHVAIEERLEAQLALGEHAQAAAELEVLVRERPLREHLWELLMVALYRCGRQAEALRAFSQARRVLCGELGVEPGLPCASWRRTSWHRPRPWSGNHRRPWRVARRASSPPRPHPALTPWWVASTRWPC